MTSDEIKDIFKRHGKQMALTEQRIFVKVAAKHAAQAVAAKSVEKQVKP